MEGVKKPLGTRRVGSRLAFAGALTVFVVGVLASFGGVSYAAAGAGHAFHAAKRVTVTSHPRVRTLSSASDEYSTPSSPSSPQGTIKGVTKSVKPKPVSKPVSASPPTSVPSGQLPFTGLSLLSTSVLGFALIGLGVVLRRREGREG
jgi:hypothetical protein